MGKRLTIVLLTMILFISLPVQAFAASAARLSNSAKSSVEKLTADSSLQTKLTEQSKKIQELELRDENLDSEIFSLHRANGEKLSAINASMKKFQADKLDKLKNDAASTRERYKPLFTLQTSLNKQLTAARQLKSKPLIEALQAQLSVVKASAVIARTEIRLKDEAYAKAKESTSKTVNSVRTVLKDVSLEQAQIRTEKKATVETSKQISVDGKSFTAALKNKDAPEALRSLTVLTTLSNQIITQKLRISSSEKKVSNLLVKAAALLPAN